MHGGKFVRFDDAETYATAPTEATHFLDAGSADMPGVAIETLDAGNGPPLHRHEWASWAVVVDGKIRIRVEDETADLAAGDYFYTEPNAAHTFMGLEGPAKVVFVDLPGGEFAEMTRTVAPLLNEAEPDMAKVTEVAAQHGLEILGPPMAAE